MKSLAMHFQRSLVKTLTLLLVFSLIAPVMGPQNVVTAQERAPRGQSTLGDFVWHDLNADGQQDSGEPGINDVFIRVWNDLGGSAGTGDAVFAPSTQSGPDTIFATATTGDNPNTAGATGYYNVQITFGGPTYWVEIDSTNFAPGGPLEGYFLTSADLSYPNPAYVIETSSIATRTDFDFGFARADIELIKVAGNAADGTTLVLPPGGDQVTFTYTYTNTGELPLQIEKIVDDLGTPNDASDDVTVCSPGVIIQPGQSGTCSYQTSITSDHTNIAQVFGTPYNNDPFSPSPLSDTPITDDDDAVVTISTPTSSIGDRVWLDANGNGIQDTGENGLPGVTVNLLDSNGSQIGTQPTNGSGNYLFDNLQPGTYTVEFAPGTSYAFSPAKVGGNNNTDSDANVNTGRTDPIQLGAGQDLITVDAGVYEPVSLGDRVWEDQNNNGIQDAGEPGVANVTVTIFESGNPSPVATTTTNSNGIYSVTDLPPGTYEVEFGTPSGYTFSPANQGGDDSLDSDANNAGRAPAITLNSGESIDTIDAGLFRPGSIGDFVWDDTDKDGIQDPGEAGLSGVTVTLLDGSGNTLQTTQTDGNGGYTFSNLTPGSYQVAFSLPTNYEYSPANSGSNDAQDSDADTTTGLSPVIQLTAGETNTSIDAGMSATVLVPASLGDFVWEDLNGNGIQDAGEAGIPNVSVQLFNNAGTQIATTQTDADGLYEFTQLDPGSYSVIFTAPSGFTFSPANQGSSDLLDSDADASGQTGTINLASGANNTTVDAGLYRPAAIGDFVWDDLNGDGIQDANEPGLDGFTVQLFQAGVSTPVASTTTSNGGAYNFTNLAPGSYQVVMTPPNGSSYVASPQNQGADDAVDSDINASGQTGVIVLTSGDINTTIDAGYYQPVTIGDFIWEDLNANGIQDANETGIPNVTVTLVDPGTGNVVSTTQTDSTGLYNFQVPPGTYQVVVTLPTDYQAAPQDQGTNDAVDSDVNSSGETAPVTATSGQSITTVDAGLFQTASLGDRVWSDTNNNGIQNAGEAGVSGVTVQLFTAGDTTPINTTQTDSNGFYLFDNLTPGSYEVVFQLPSGYQFSPANQGSSDTQDSDADTTTGRTPAVTLASGQSNTSVDAGMYIPVSPNPDYSINKQVIPSGDASDGIIVVGQEVRYSITVVNTGNTALTTIPLTDNFDTEFLAYLNGTPIPDNVDPANGLLTWNDITGNSTLAPGQSIVLGVTFQAVKSTDLEPNKQTLNVAAVSGAQDENGTTLPDKDDDAPIRITDPRIGISKSTTSPANGIVTVGEEVIFTIQLNNLGDTTLIEIPVIDIYESEILQYVSTDISAPSVSVNGNNGRLEWADVTTDLGDLAPGASVSYQVTFRLLTNTQTTNLAETDTSTDENGDPVAPVIGSSGADVIPQAAVYGLFLPGVANQPPPAATPTPTPTNTPTPTPTPVPTIPGLGEEECPPNGCPVEGLVHPKDLTVHNRLQMLFIVSRDTKQLIKFDPDTNQVVGTAATGLEPWDVAIDEDSDQVYVTNYGSEDVWVYDANTMALKTKIRVGPNPMMAEVLPNVDTVAVIIRGGNGVALINTNSNTMGDTLSAGGSGPFGLAVDRVNSRIFVSNRDTGNGWVYYNEGGTWFRGTEFKFGNNLGGYVAFDLVYNEANQKLYGIYVEGSGQWYVDINKVESPQRIVRVGRVAVESSGSNRDSEVGGAGLAVNPNNNHVYTANTYADSVSIISGDTDQLVATIPVGDDPYDIAVNPTTDTVYISLRAPNRVVKFVDLY